MEAKISPLPGHTHWKYSGLYKIQIVGTSYYRPAIAAIAQNLPGHPAFAIAIAYLVLEDHNPHDENAVKVVVSGRTVGHLSATYAKSYRAHISELPPHIRHVSVHAAITGGLRTKDREYEYKVELDLPDSLKLHTLVEPVENQTVRANGYAPLQRAANGSYFANVWLPTADFNELDKNRKVKEWTTDQWETVNYYAMNRQCIGLGLKIYELQKAQYSTFFKGRNTAASLVFGEGRIATLHINAG